MKVKRSWHRKETTLRAISRQLIVSTAAHEVVVVVEGCSSGRFRILSEPTNIATSPAWIGALRKHGVPRFANFARYVDGETSVAALAGFAQSELTGNHTWEEIARIRDRWKRPLVLKGVILLRLAFALRRARTA